MERLACSRLRALDMVECLCDWCDLRGVRGVRGVRFVRFYTYRECCTRICVTEHWPLVVHRRQ